MRASIASFLEAGCGFGGSCLPKDALALIAHGARLGQPLPVLEAVMETNAGRPDAVMALVRRQVPDLRGARVAVLGIAFKPDTNDTRESPAIPIIERLVADGALVTVHDPVVTDLPAALSAHADEIAMSSNLEESLQGADAVVLVTRWEEYREVPRLLAQQDPQPAFVDGRRMLDKRLFDRYAGIGL